VGKKGCKSNKGSILEAGERESKMRTVIINLARFLNEEKSLRCFPATHMEREKVLWCSKNGAEIGEPRVSPTSLPPCLQCSVKSCCRAWGKGRAAVRRVLGKDGAERESQP